MPPPLSELPSETSSVVHPKEQPATHNQGASHPTHPSLVTAKVIQKHNSKPLEKPGHCLHNAFKLDFAKGLLHFLPLGTKWQEGPSPFLEYPSKAHPAWS